MNRKLYQSKRSNDLYSRVKGRYYMPQNIDIDSLKGTYKSYKDYMENRKIISKNSIQKDMMDILFDELEEKNPYFSRYIYSGIINV